MSYGETQCSEARRFRNTLMYRRLTDLRCLVSARCTIERMNSVAI